MINAKRTVKAILLGLLASLTIGAATAQAMLDPTLLSAYFGLDNALPFAANRLCRGAANLDGMPIIFSMVIDETTLDKADFAVTTASGVVSTPVCVTLNPAIDLGELRTVLITGEFGNAESDAPVRVEIVGDIFASADSAVNFLGASVEVTPLAAGPFLVIAETIPLAQWQLDRASGSQQGDGCPSVDTAQVVRVTWAGGISNSAGDEAGAVERDLYRVTLQLPDGTQSEVTPFALSDLGDGDNNHLLCLDQRGEPLSVFFPAGYLLDPARDTLNPDTTVAVQSAPGSIPSTYRNVRYCEVIPTYRSGITLRTEIWNTLGLNDCP
ncbi:MAG: hypothetical protein H7Y11_15140, partial [Armatimonadetes bacterium]|nr:hypothetical protein [Anaerolineae bacterium]